MTDVTGSDSRKSNESLTVKSVSDILAAKSPSLISLTRTHGEKKVLISIRAILIDFSNFVGQELNDSQLNQASRLILETYPNYKPEHLKLCFDRIKSGKYGTIYGAVNGLVIMEFIKKFDIQLDEETTEIRQTEARINKKEPGLIEFISNGSSEDQKKAEAFRLLKADLLKIGKEKENDHKIAPTIKINAPTDLTQVWLREFDELFVKTGDIRKPIKIVEVEGIKMSLLMFLDYKEKQLKGV